MSHCGIVGDYVYAYPQAEGQLDLEQDFPAQLSRQLLEHQWFTSGPKQADWDLGPGTERWREGRREAKEGGRGGEEGGSEGGRDGS